jgi:putative chitinase
MSEFITAEQLRKIMPAMRIATSVIVVASLNKLLPVYEMDQPDRFHEFIARIAVESQQFTHLQENLNYSADRLHAVWPSRFPTVASAEPYAHNAQKLANHVYANRMGNGDEASGDGYTHRGVGPMQLTGKDMHAKYAKYKNIPIDQVVPFILANTDNSVDSALWLFCIEKDLEASADNDDMLTITKKINGGTLGYKESLPFLERAREVLPIQS